MTRFFFLISYFILYLRKFEFSERSDPKGPLTLFGLSLFLPFLWLGLKRTNNSWAVKYIFFESKLYMDNFSSGNPQKNTLSKFLCRNHRRTVFLVKIVSSNIARALYYSQWKIFELIYFWVENERIVLKTSNNDVKRI